MVETEEITPDQLAEDSFLGGYHTDPSIRKWNPGACWPSEGQWLYRLVRRLKPKTIVEVGVFEGCSASHLALACKHNGFGKVFGLDNRQEIGDRTGCDIPEHLRPFIQLIWCDALTYKFQKIMRRSIDLLVEDGSHSTGFTKAVLEHLKAKHVVVHDYFHFDAGKVVKPESESVLGEPTETFFEPPADCGYAYFDCTK
jgi:hypothetical protein